MVNYKKLQTETEQEYIFRICDIKQEIGSWKAVCELLNVELKQNYSSSKYRKPYQDFQKGFEVNKHKYLNDEYIQVLEEKKQEIQEERYKIQALNIPINREARQNARKQLHYENLKEAMESLPIPEFNEIKPNRNDNKCWVLGMGDFHFGAKFKSENNEYSRDICKIRLESLLGILAVEIENNDIRKIKVLNVADTIQGILRLTDLKLNEIPVVESVVEISRLLGLFLNKLSKYCEVEYYHCSCANHSQIRPLGSKASELVAEDMEKIIVSYITDLVAKNHRVKVISDLSKDYLTFDIFSFKSIILHGHQVKSPKDTIKNYSNLHREFYDYAFLGHRHSANEIIVGEGNNHNIEVLTCPSFVGSDPYADSLMVGAKAMVKLYEFDSIYGHIGSKNIILN